MDNVQAVSPAGFFHPAGKLYRYTLLFFVGLIPIGSYFAYDSVGALENTLMRVMNISPSTIGALYNAYSVAAILVVFFGGVLIDKLGTRTASLLFSGLVTLGAIIVAWAPDTTWLFIGRLVFGAGSESLIVAQSAILARWFKGKELALAFGVSLTLMRVGTLFSFNTEELIARYFNDYKYALWAAVVICVFSIGCNVLYCFLDRRGEKILRLAEAGGGDKIVIGDIKKLPKSFWYITLLCMTFYSAIFPFTALSTHMFAEKWGLPETIAGSGSFLYQVFQNLFNMFSTAPGVTSIVIFSSMILAPFAGKLVDRIGRRASLMVLGALLMIPAHLLLGLTRFNPVVCMFMLGAAFVLVPAALWPSVPLIVEENRVGTAFGLMTAIQNIGLAIFPLFNGWLRDATQDYTASQLVFASLGVAGMVFAFLLMRQDAKSGRILELPKIN